MHEGRGFSPNSAIDGCVGLASVYEVRPVTTDENLRDVHHKQHEDKIDPIVFEPVQRPPPTHFCSALKAFLAVFTLSDENKFSDPQLNDKSNFMHRHSYLNISFLPVESARGQRV